MTHIINIVFRCNLLTIIQDQALSLYLWQIIVNGNQLWHHLIYSYRRHSSDYYMEIVLLNTLRRFVCFFHNKHFSYNRDDENTMTLSSYLIFVLNCYLSIDRYTLLGMTVHNIRKHKSTYFDKSDIRVPYAVLI